MKGMENPLKSERKKKKTNLTGTIFFGQGDMSGSSYKTVGTTVLRGGREKEH